MRLCRIPSCYPSIEKPNAATHRNGHVSITTGTPIWFATGVYMPTSDSGISMLTFSEYRACFSHAPRCGRLFQHPIVGNTPSSEERRGGNECGGTCRYRGWRVN